MSNFFSISQSILAIALIILVLIQPKGSGLGSTFGGGSTSFTKRGVEKAVFRLTFVITALFISVSVLSLVF
jgi:protein translocase SecG subunit